MPSDPNILSSERTTLRGAEAALPIPSFGMLPRGSLLRRIKSNFADCFTTSPKGITPWQFAAMFRSAYFPRRFPTRPLLESIFLHVCVLTYLISQPPTQSPRREMNEVETARAGNRIIYYRPADRLPPVSPPEPKVPAEPPRPAPQPVRIRVRFDPVERVVSRPPLPDNSRQTIVQPEAPQLRLPTEVQIPNIVEVRPIPPPPPSVSEGQRQLAQIRVPQLVAPPVAAPTPVPPKLTLPELSVPPAPIAELPDAPVPPSPLVGEALRQAAELRTPRTPVPEVARPTVAIPAPPTATPEADAASLPSLVAVGVAPPPPHERLQLRIPLGNRSGEFAVSPEGEKSEAARSGQPAAAPPLPNLGNVADIHVPNLSIAGDRTGAPPPPVPVTSEPPPEPRASAIPAPIQPPGDLRTLMARAARPSLIPEMTRGKAREAEPGAFGSRRVYTVYINMPNLASGAGSWILRFAERDDNGAGGSEGAGEEEISSPVAVRKVDPKYTPSAARERVQGTVTLAAQILRNGTVASVKVVQGLDPRLDLSAVQALTLWQFEPARKKGIPIDLEVLVQIPFQLPGL